LGVGAAASGLSAKPRSEGGAAVSDDLAVNFGAGAAAVVAG
jgi:hypothetical protein